MIINHLLSPLLEIKAKKIPNVILLCYVIFIPLQQNCSYAIGDSLQYDKGRTHSTLGTYSQSVGNALEL